MAEKPTLSSSRIVLDEDAVAAFEALYDQGLTDGLPVIPPTEERVRAMLAGMPRSPGEVISVMPPGRGEVTVEKLAVNAVMAGCRPEYMPVLVASVEAMAPPEFNMDALQVTTHSAAPMIIVNGPVRDRLDINSGNNAMGQGWRANATIGRALRLVMVNVGGAIPGSVDKATQGMPGKFTFCFGENEEESPWEPLHVERGLQLADSAVTIVAAGGTNHIVNGSSDGEDVLKSLTYGMVSPSTNNMVDPEGEPMLLLCPAHAQLLSDAGYTKERVKQHLFEQARVPVQWLSPYVIKRRRAGGYELAGAESIPMASRPENFMLAVVGGSGALHSTFVPTLGPSKAQTRRIEASA